MSTFNAQAETDENANAVTIAAPRSTDIAFTICMDPHLICAAQNS
jgi:ABC-type branched-subunit amino acid transport system ATPase component